MQNMRFEAVKAESCTLVPQSDFLRGLSVVSTTRSFNIEEKGGKVPSSQEVCIEKHSFCNLRLCSHEYVALQRHESAALYS
jgi:hypothetical protein